MEVFAAFAAHTDYEIGRVVKAIEDMGELDNTLILYEVGDNGASAEGGMNGMFNEMTYFNGVAGDGARHAEEHRQVGRPRDLPAHGGGLGGGRQHAVHVDQAGRRPTSAARATRWSSAGPTGIKAKGEIRSQFHHVVDIAPTVLEAAGLPEPKTVNGVAQTPMEGVSMVYTFDDAKAADRHKTQYFEIFGNRAIYHDGWVAATVHKAPWEAEPRHTLAEDVWELYNVDEDFSESNDLAASQPGQAQGAAGALHEGSRALPRAADRRPRRSSGSTRPWRAVRT